MFEQPDTLKEFKTFFDSKNDEGISDHVANQFKALINQLDGEQLKDALFYVLRGDVEDEELREKPASVECVELLMEKGVDPKIENSTGTTPLSFATSFGYTECARLLIDHGADAREIDGTGESLLEMAVRENRIGCVQLLLEKGAAEGINYIDESIDMTVLDVAENDGCAECVELLRSYGGRSAVELQNAAEQAEEITGDVPDFNG